MEMTDKLAEMQSELDQLREKLEIADAAIAIATDDQQLDWQIRRLELTERLDEMTAEVAQAAADLFSLGGATGCEPENASKEAECAPDEIDDATAEAMINAILSAVEPEEAPPGEEPAGEPEQETAVSDSADSPQEKNDEPDAGESDERIFGLIADAQALRSSAERELGQAREEAERMTREAERIRTEAERARCEAEAEISARQHRAEPETDLSVGEKTRAANNIARRKTEIAALRNGLNEVRDSESAFALREKFFALQTGLDDEERLSPEIGFLLSKSLDDINYALEIAQLKNRISALARAYARRASAKNPSGKDRARSSGESRSRGQTAANGVRRRPVPSAAPRSAPRGTDERFPKPRGY